MINAYIFVSEKILSDSKVPPTPHLVHFRGIAKYAETENK